MKNLLKLAPLIFSFFVAPMNYSAAQSSDLQYVDRGDLELFKRNEWELFYTSEKLKIDQFDVFSSGFVTATDIDRYEVKITLYDAANIIVDEKKIRHSKPWLFHNPRFLKSKEEILIAPLFKNQYYIDVKAEKIRRKSSKFLRDKSRYYKREFDFGASQLKFFNSVDFKNNQIAFLTLLEKEKAVDTLHFSVKRTEALSYFGYTDYIEIIPFKKRIFILDNSQDSIFIFKETGHLIDKVSLPYLSSAKMGLLSFKLELDQSAGKVYLFSIQEKNKFWLLKNIGDDKYNLTEKSINDTKFHHVNIHNNYIYNVFYLIDRKQYSIYRRKINE